MNALNKNVRNEILEISFSQKQITKESDLSNTYVALFLVLICIATKILFIIFN